MHFLHLEDSPLDAELVVFALKRAGITSSIVQARDEEQFRQALAAEQFDLVLSDYSLPSFNGLAALRILRENYPDTPFILVSGTIGEEAAIQSLKSGAADYVLKHQFEKLGPAIHRALRECKERAERRRAQEELATVNQAMREVSRQAGKAEVAIGVLHNVGNVLNSANVSASLVADLLDRSKVGNLSKAISFLSEHQHDLANFLNHDQKGRQLITYLQKLAKRMSQENEELKSELKSLRRNIEHIRDIVSLQQNHAKISGLIEILPPEHLMETALALNDHNLVRDNVRVERAFLPVPAVAVDKHRVLQILVNLIRNANEAMHDSATPDKRLKLGISLNEAQRVCLSVQDNGVGIAPENLNRIFSYGFTTKRTGHGFGLHASANDAKAMGGALTLHSEGLGHGTTFVLELPVGRDSLDASHQSLTETNPFPPVKIQTLAAIR